MLHNNGPFGPNDAPMNVGTPVNMTQMNIGSSINNLSKIAQQPIETTSTQYNLPSYTNFGHPQLNLNQQMSPFPTYQPLGFQSNFIPQNSTSVHENNWQNGMLPMNLNLQGIHGHNMLNYPAPLSKTPQDLNADQKEPTKISTSLNIPEVPLKSFQKLDTDNNPYNMNKDKFNGYLINSDFPSEKPLLDNTKRKSLENTVRLIEDILINTTKNKEQQRNQDVQKNPIETISTENTESKEDYITIDELKTEQNNEEKKSFNETNPIDDHISKSDEENVTSETEQSSSESEEDVKPPIETIEIKLEMDTGVDVKVENVYWTDTEFTNPFHRDVNSTARDDACGVIIDCENSVNEAMAVIKSGM